MAIDIGNYLDRITEIQKLVTGATTHASKFANYRQSDFPYWTNELSASSQPEQFAAFEWRYDITIIMRLHRGVPMEGEEGQLELVCQQDVIDTLNQFLTRKLLTTATYTTPQAGYAPNSLRITPQGTGELSETGDYGSQYILQFSHYEYEG